MSVIRSNSSDKYGCLVHNSFFGTNKPGHYTVGTFKQNKQMNIYPVCGTNKNILDRLPYTQCFGVIN